MKANGAITLLLLLFVGGSVGYFAYQELRGPSNLLPAEDWSQEEHKVLAYFFHASQRCPTCRKIEAYSREALEEGYPEALRSGLLEWRVLSYDDPRNQKIVDEYEVLTSTLVLVEWRRGEDKRWKNLEDKVWELVGDKDAFLKYVRSEAEPLLESADG